MFTHGKLTTFKEIMNEFFYDWKMTPDPQIHKESDGFWVNKTSLFMEDGKFYLTYKTSSYEVTESAYNQFCDFYDSLYEDDKEFALILDAIEWEWKGSNELVKTSNGFKIENIQIKTENSRYFLVTESETKAIQEKTFEKVSRFYQMLNS